MMLGRLLGLSAILLQIAVFLQPLLPEKHSVFSVCKTIAVALDLQVNSTHKTLNFPTSHPHAHHHTSAADQNDVQVVTDVQDQHAPHQQQNDSHSTHDCQFCLVHSYTLPLLDTKLRPVLVRTQTLLLFFSASVPHVLTPPAPWFLIPQGRAPPLTLTH
ncbi:DUF2946 domain-containing protein [Acinetobacter sp. CS-2]|nr:DUF2946 domain-containing protein [Acinetobacter sp. CS-2]